MSNLDDDIDCLFAELSLESNYPTDDFSLDDLDSFISDLDGTSRTQRVISTKAPNLKRKGKYASNGAVSGNDLENLLSMLETRASTVQFLKPKASCFTCKKDIIGDVVEILGRSYHPEHVSCQLCSMRATDGKYFDQKGLITCANCYAKSGEGPNCGTCQKPISGLYIETNGNKYHEACFVCSSCRRPFEGGKYINRESGPMCADCVSKEQVCRMCTKSIEDQAISALGGYFHSECFGCRVCKKPFGKGFCQADGFPYCEKHYLEKMGIVICGGCQKPIRDEYVEALGKKWHPEHFRCSFCMKALDPTYKENDGKAYCANCYKDIY